MVESAALLVDEVLPRLPMRQWVLSVPYPLRFLFARESQVMGKVMSIVYRTIASYLIQQAGLTRRVARTGAVTLIQRFGSALNLNVHLHMLFLDGVYVADSDPTVAPAFRRVPAPTTAQLQAVLEHISQRIGRYLEHQGLLVRDPENDYLQLDALDEEAACMDRLRGHSITYRIALGRHAGRKAFTLQTLPATEALGDEHLAKAAGFSLHAGVWAGANDRAKLERLCRYIARPAVSNERIALTECGHVRYTLKTPYRDGTTHVYFSPLDFMARLAALVPKPRVNLTRFHGVFAPNSKLRSQVTLSGRGKRLATAAQTPAERHQAMGWAQLLKRVFQIDITHCEHCGGKVKIIGSIEDAATIRRILEHLERRARGPPVQGDSLAH
jgi:hypothetical protein